MQKNCRIPCLPVITLDISYMSVTSESAPLDGRFRDVGITTEEGRVLRDLGKLYIRLQTGMNSARKSPGWTDGMILSTCSTTALRGKGLQRA